MGETLNRMLAWCAANAAGEWRQYGYQRPQELEQEPMADVVRFYFMQPADAELFRRQWGGVLVLTREASARRRVIQLVVRQ